MGSDLSWIDDVEIIRATLKRARRIARMYDRGGLHSLYLACGTVQEALDRLEETLKCGLDGDKESTISEEG